MTSLRSCSAESTSMPLSSRLSHYIVLPSLCCHPHLMYISSYSIFCLILYPHPTLCLGLSFFCRIMIMCSPCYFITSHIPAHHLHKSSLWLAAPAPKLWPEVLRQFPSIGRPVSFYSFFPIVTRVSPINS